MELENYNDWNLPFAKTLTIQAEDSTDQSFPTTKYILEIDPASFITVIFVDTYLSIPDTPIQMNYTWYGENGFTIKGCWKEVLINVTVSTETEPV